MHRVKPEEALDVALDLFGKGKHGYQGGDQKTGRRGTQFPASSKNAEQEELARAVEDSGRRLDEKNHHQLSEVIQDAVSGIHNQDGKPEAWRKRGRDNLKLGDSATRDVGTTDKHVARGDVQAQLAPFVLPVGAMIAWGSATPPDGWLECNGQAFDRAKNPNLLKVYPSGHVPDFRGKFPRGWAHGSAEDPDSGRAMLSSQPASDLNHYHLTGQFTAQGGYHADDNNFPLRAQSWAGESYRAKTVQGYVGGVEHRQVPGQASGEVSSSSNPRWLATGESATPPEVRPKNLAVMFIIKTDGADGIAPTPTPGSLLVSPETVTGVVGGVQALTATVLPADLAGAYPVSWSSSNPSVVTVTQAGVVNFVAAGKAEIVASISSGLVARCRVTVHTVLTALALAGLPSLDAGKTHQLVVTKTPSAATEPMTFTVDKPEICTVSDSGELTGRAAGEYRVTVTGTISKISANQTGRVVAVSNFAAVGSYAFLRVINESQQPNIAPGSIVNGSLMRFAGTAVGAGTPAVPGTWECCGAISNTREASVFRRVS